jgi:glycosyltransferase involved in cell wall biosynthesis
MKLTIITITYNAEKVLERTLKSVFDQTNQAFEYLMYILNLTMVFMMP